MGGAPEVSGLLVRTAADPSTFIDPIRRLVLSGRSSRSYLRVQPYAQLLERQVHPWRLGVTLLGMFSILAMAVAALGLYAAFAHAVSVRTREMAIRIAIGSSPARVLTMILGEAARLSISGIAAGAFGAVLGGRTLESLLFGFVPDDPVVIGCAGLAMLLVVLIATWLPARRASRVDPHAILRAE